MYPKTIIDISMIATGADFMEQLNWSGKTILIIEDDEATSMLIEEYLSDTNANFISSSHREALTFVTREKIDLIINGVNYRELQSGFEHTKKLRLKYKNTPFIACSACCSQSDIKECYEAGYNEFIAKPMDMNLLVHILTTYL